MKKQKFKILCRFYSTDETYAIIEDVMGEDIGNGCFIYTEPKTRKYIICDINTGLSIIFSRKGEKKQELINRFNDMYLERVIKHRTSDTYKKQIQRFNEAKETNKYDYY